MKQNYFCTTFIFLLAASCLVTEATAQQPRPVATGNLARELNVTQHRFSGTRGTIDYCLAVENKELPGEMSLVLILHGGSGSGDDNARQLTSPAVKPLLDFVRTHKQKCVIIIPQCPADRDWVRAANGNTLVSVIAELVREKSKEFAVSPSRLYLTGVSMGGGACYVLQARENNLFVKMIVVSAGGRVENVAKLTGDIYIIHGEQDTIFPVEQARTMEDTIRRNSEATVKLTVLPNRDHVSTASAAYSEETWRWFFPPPAPAQPPPQRTAPAQQTQSRVPKIGYIYPAGGQQGTTFLMLIGGRDITRSSEIIVSGNGVSGRVVRDTLALHINDANERRLIHQLYWEALATLQGTTNLPPLPPTPPQSADATPLPTTEDVMNKYPYIELLKNPTWTDLELVYDYYFSPRLERKPLAEILNRGVLLEMTIAPNAEPGDRDFRLLGPSGMTPPARFMVGIYPEVREQEPNNTLSEDPASKNFRWQNAALAPQSIRSQSPLELPVVINGQIHTGDVDRFSFTAKQGQKLVIDVQARHLRPYLADAVPGWFQATIALFDSDDKKIDEAMSYRYEPDPVLLFDVPKDGVYALAIQDSLFRGRDDFVYRITIAESPLVTSVFPLKDRSQNLPETTENDLNDDFEQAKTFQQPIIINGRIADENDVDVFAFEGRKGERIVLDVTARSLGSPLDAMLELFDTDKKLIASNDDRADSRGPNIGLQTHHADPYLNVELPADGRYYVRLYDVTQRGGEAFAYRLRISPPQGDFAVFCEPSSLVLRGNTPQTLKMHLIRKDGFDGAVRLRLANADVFQIENGLIADGANETAVSLRALPRYQGAIREVVLEAVATIGGKDVVRQVIAMDDMEQAFIYHHWVPAKSLVISRPRPQQQPAPVR